MAVAYRNPISTLAKGSSSVNFPSRYFWVTVTRCDRFTLPDSRNQSDYIFPIWHWVVLNSCRSLQGLLARILIGARYYTRLVCHSICTSTQCVIVSVSLSSKYISHTMLHDLDSVHRAPLYILRVGLAWPSAELATYITLGHEIGSRALPKGMALPSLCRQAHWCMNFVSYLRVSYTGIMIFLSGSMFLFTLHRYLVSETLRNGYVHIQLRHDHQSIICLYVHTLSHDLRAQPCSEGPHPSIVETRGQTLSWAIVTNWTRISILGQMEPITGR